MPTKEPKPPSPFDPFMSKKQVLADIRRHSSTLDQWIKKGIFPPPNVLNEGMGGREILGWPTSVYLAWKAALPVRQAKPISENAYKGRRRRKRITRPK